MRLEFGKFQFYLAVFQTKLKFDKLEFPKRKFTKVELKFTKLQWNILIKNIKLDNTCEFTKFDFHLKLKFQKGLHN